MKAFVLAALFLLCMGTLSYGMECFPPCGRGELCSCDRFGCHCVRERERRQECIPGLNQCNRGEECACKCKQRCRSSFECECGKTCYLGLCASMDETYPAPGK